MSYKKTIIDWLKDYAIQANMKGFVVGVSGGVDSAVTSTLCALTGLPVYAVGLPIPSGFEAEVLQSRSDLQLDWLKNNYSNVTTEVISLDKVYNVFSGEVGSDALGYANMKARIRMTALYALASRENSLVVGTGNKVEDFGVGFFTKYGDGGVDISPIADLMKTEVFELASELNVPQEIQDAPPTDGLWGDGRTDEDQLNATYEELEWAMTYNSERRLLAREQEVLKIYNDLHSANEHKMLPIPVCKLK
jgi:NAD+ synthase|tara:strand:- start:3741 stop:4487 length:747 start_codon:yes stop_codon:yes gene_type:complete